MRTTSILSLLYLLLLFCSTMNAQMRIFDTNSITSLGYSAGPGHGLSLILERLSETEKGEVGLSAVINLRSVPIEDGTLLDLIIASRVNYHPFDLNTNDRFDPYAFATLGVGFEDINNDSNYMGTRQEKQTRYTPWGFGAGLRFRVYNSFGVFAEASYGTGWITAGISWRAF